MIIALPYTRNPDRIVARFGFAPDGEVTYDGAPFRQYRLTRDAWSRARQHAADRIDDPPDLRPVDQALVSVGNRIVLTRCRRRSGVGSWSIRLRMATITSSMNAAFSSSLSHSENCRYETESASGFAPSRPR